MKHVFVPDENVLMRAVKCNERAREFWMVIASGNHMIAVNDDWIRYFLKRLKREKKRINSHFPNIVDIIHTLLKNPDKCDYRLPVQSVPEEIMVRHEKDRYLLRIVAAGGSGGLLVSTDSRTRSDFNRPEISEKYATEGLTIEKALALAKKE